MRRLLTAVGIAALAGCHKSQPQTNASTPAVQIRVKGVDRTHKGTLAPAAAFVDADGKSVTFANFRGAPVLLNLWASWCAPCVKELPTLDKLAQSQRIRVVTISEDDGPHPSVVAFLDKLNAHHLGSYQDSGMAFSAALGPDTVLPTTILYNSNGKEVWRYVGGFDWTSPQAATLISEAKPGGSA
jgi:thiol-disulfide isomerase/thioredoxin